MSDHLINLIFTDNNRPQHNLVSNLYKRRRGLVIIQSVRTTVRNNVAVTIGMKLIFSTFHFHFPNTICQRAYFYSHSGLYE